MQEIIFNSVRFIKLYLRNYGIFLRSNELNFNRHCTLIVGRNGTGWIQYRQSNEFSNQRNSKKMMR